MNINKIKCYIKSKIGSKVVVVSFQNRNREEKCEGIINNVYNNVFTIILKNGRCRSYSYVDIFIGNVRVYI